jgi:hypothetical protein
MIASTPDGSIGGGNVNKGLILHLNSVYRISTDAVGEKGGGIETVR